MKQIFISQRVEILEKIGERRDSLSQEWAEIAYTCGFIPVMIPNKPILAVEMLQQIPDGIILTGGNDLTFYGGSAPERDETENLLIQYAIEHRIPLLGVCRGMQMLLHYFGIKLERIEGHVRIEHMLSTGHSVNSFHSWGVFVCPPPLVVLAYSSDGVVEAVTHEVYDNLTGIMWHPERYHPLREKEILWIRSIFSI